jgi:hypothetical protein
VKKLEKLTIEPKSENFSEIIENLVDLFEIWTDLNADSDLDSDLRIVEFQTNIQEISQILKNKN